MNAGEANHTARAVAWARTRQLQRALYRAAKASPTRRFHALYDKVCDPDILQSAWEAVRANRGAPGIDGETIQAIEERGVAAKAAAEEILQAARTGAAEILRTAKAQADETITMAKAAAETLGAVETQAEETITAAKTAAEEILHQGKHR